MSRQEYLRTRERVYSITDPLPVEAAVLDRREDTMRDMVRQQVASMAALQRDELDEDDEFLSDEEFDLEQALAEGPLSDYQLTEIAEDLSSLDEPDPHEGSVAMSHPDMVNATDPREDDSSGDPSPVPQVSNEAPHST